MREENKNNFKPDRKRENKDKYVPLDMTCLSSGYFSDAERQKLKDSLIGKDAERIGKTLANLEPELTVTQLRKFFNETRSLEERLKEDNFQKALIQMLKSKVAFSVAKKSSKVPEEFKDFIFACVDKINDEKDFYGFSKFFESIVGYFYYFKEENKSKKEESE